jgi:hypothetical protein
MEGGWKEDLTGDGKEIEGSDWRWKGDRKDEKLKRRLRRRFELEMERRLNRRFDLTLAIKILLKIKR